MTISYLRTVANSNPICIITCVYSVYRYYQVFVITGLRHCIGEDQLHPETLILLYIIVIRIIYNYV